MARVQLHTLYSPAPVPCGFTHVNPTPPCREERAGRRGGGGGGGGGAGGGGRGALLPARSPGRADASRTPRTRKEGCGWGGSGRPARFGGAAAALSCPRSPLGPSALGLFHWRTLPKMVICVRGRECGFPCFRVTWRERDSLAGSRARRGLPLPPPHTHTALERGAGRGPRERPLGPRRRVSENNHSPEERDWQFSAAPPPGREPGAQSGSQGGRGYAWSSAPSAAPRVAAGALGTQGTRAALRPGFGGAQRLWAGPACLFFA